MRNIPWFMISLGMVLSGFLASLVLWPSLDLTISALFYHPGEGFYMAHNSLPLAMQWLAYYGARFLGCMLAAAALMACVRPCAPAGIDARGWLFLFLALIIGPVLIANAGFKDHWGRARPREVIQFGGGEEFSPALIPQAHGHKNSSFVSGDAAFGFFLPGFAYVVAAPRSRRVFWAGIMGGALFGFSRIIMGAHFTSDVLFAGLLMTASSAVLFRFMYGYPLLRQKWRDWLGLTSSEK